MKKYSILLAGIVLALSVGVFAKEKHGGSATFTTPTQVGKLQLQPGDYKVEWNGTAPDVQVNFIKDGKLVGTAPAKLVDQKNPYPAIETTTGSNNAQVLNEIDWKSMSLVFSDSSGAAGSSGAGSQ
jgi:hypothetical protein